MKPMYKKSDVDKLIKKFEALSENLNTLIQALNDLEVQDAE
jgi:hypothetical protein